MVYSLKDFESLWFLYQAEGLPKNISIEEFCTKHRDDFPIFDKWYRKTQKKVYPITITGRLEEDKAIQVEPEKVSEESQVHDPVKHPFKYPTDRVANINKKISISIKFPDVMKIVKTGISTKKAALAEETESAEQTQKSFEYRKGMKYQTMFADNRIVHESDRNLLTECATYIRSEFKSSYDQVSYIGTFTI